MKRSSLSRHVHIRLIQVGNNAFVRASVEGTQEQTAQFTKAWETPQSQAGGETNKNGSKEQGTFWPLLAQGTSHPNRDRCAQRVRELKQRQGCGVRAHQHPECKHRHMVTKSQQNRNTQPQGWRFLTAGSVPFGVFLELPELWSGNGQSAPFGGAILEKGSVHEEKHYRRYWSQIVVIIVILTQIVWVAGRWLFSKLQ